MTKEEVLQRANDYCSERSYDESTLTLEFKDKFADFFAKRNPEGDINDEAIIADLKFNLDTARSAALRGIATSKNEFETKENELKAQIEELNKKIGKKTTPKVEQVIPKEIQEQLDELKMFRNNEAKKEKFKNIMGIAKKGIRQDLHKSFETFAADYSVDLDKDDKEQATAMVSRFQEIFRDSIGDIRPLAPQQIRKRDAEAMSALKPMKV